jgi:hypothetical protein
MSEAIIPIKRAAATPAAEFTLITPEWCEQMLKHHNRRNRTIRNSVVARYVAAMQAGHWPMTGQPIILDWNGDVLDGQHRMTACMQSGVPIYILVVSGIDPAVMPAIDKNAPRKTRDTFGLLGKPKPGDRSAVVRPLWALSNGVSLGNTTSLFALDDFTLDEVDNQFSEILDAALPLAERLYKSRGLGKKSWGTAIAWMLHEGANPELVREFAESVETGVQLSAEDPRYQLRNWCERARRVGGQKRTLRPDELVIAVIKAWNFWVTGKTVKTFAVKPSEPIPSVEIGA